ncbi:hypothetical protein ACF0H5_000412 [Mactra antiquata]
MEQCLHISGGVLYAKSAKACKIVITCAKLHNICVDGNIPMPVPDANIQPGIQEDEEGFNHINNEELSAMAYHQQIISLF